jgi:hypothetical protein
LVCHIDIEQRQRVFKKRALRKMFGLKREASNERLEITAYREASRFVLFT